MRDTLTSPRVEDMKRKRRAYRRRLSILLSIFFVILIGALAYFSSHPRVTIKTVVTSGTRIINPSDVETAVYANLSGKYVYLFAKGNSIIYPKKKIYADILHRFPRIDTLSIYRDNLTTLHVAITERSGSYLYCGALVPETVTDIGENCYFVNSDGYVFDKAPYFSGNVYFKYYMAPSDQTTESPLGLSILPAERFHRLAQFIEGITALGFKPIYVVKEGDGTGSLYLAHTESTTAPKIVFNDDNDFNAILGNLSASMAKPEFANEINSKYSTLLYIDLRFNNKVVYKFQ